MAEYIKREDAERTLLERCKETGYGGLTPDDIRLVMRTPWRIPTADVTERKHGKWIDCDDVHYGWNTWQCSVCGDEFILEEGTPDVNGYNFCPNCGADMREPPKEE